SHKVKLLAPLYKERSEFLKKIPGVWLKAMTNSHQLSTFIDPVDRDALEHLEDLTIEHDPEDPRNITFHFHWSKSNPYFSDRILSKAFKIVTEETANGESNTTPFQKISQKYDLDHDLSSEVVKINWSSKDHDLISKKPFKDIHEIGSDQNFDGSSGSFFNFFNSTDDRYMMHAILLELHSKVLDLYAGLQEADDEEFDSGDEEDEEDDDPNKVVDLGEDSNDEELPKKKKAKTSKK
ncbi:hypothetical protein CROQUDRAFT_658065, partial [Cronartium quercuum f. sp. fusiforme G11]